MIKPDRISFFSQLPQYIELTNITGTMAISGTVPDGGSLSFVTIMVIDVSAAKCDIYASNGNTGLSTLISSINQPVVIDYAGFESPQQYIEYTTSTVKVVWTISNYSGAPGVLISQTVTLTAVPYKLPI